MYSSAASISSIASRSVRSMTVTASAGRSARVIASRRIFAIAVLEKMASDPPRRMTAFPDLTQRAAASAVTFGRDS